MQRQAGVVRAKDFKASDRSFRSFCHLEYFSLAKNVKDKKEDLQVSFNLNFYTIMSYAMKSIF